MTEQGPAVPTKFLVSSQVHAAAKAKAAERKLPVSQVVIATFTEYLESDPLPAGAEQLPQETVREMQNLARVNSELLTSLLVRLADDGWTFPELAEPFGISRQAVEQRVRKARAAVQDGKKELLPLDSLHVPAPRPFAAGRDRDHTFSVRVPAALVSSVRERAAREGAVLNSIVDEGLRRFSQDDAALLSRLAQARGKEDEGDSDG